MSVRPRLKKHQKALPTPNVGSYRLTPASTSSTQRSRRQQQHRALVLLPNGVKLTQNPALPRLPGQVGLHGDRPVDLQDFTSAAKESERPTTPPEGGYFDATEFISPSKHRTKRLRQWERWTTEILPLSIPAYLELQRSTQSLRKDAPINVQEQPCQCCLSPRKLMVLVIRFSSGSLNHIFLLVQAEFSYYRHRAHGALGLRLFKSSGSTDSQWAFSFFPNLSNSRRRDPSSGFCSTTFSSHSTESHCLV